MDKSSSVIKIGSFLIITLGTDMLDEEINNLQIDVLKKIKKNKIKGVLINIFSLNIIDSFMARAISDIASMCMLMNAKTVVAGMQPSVAITMAELGLELKGVYMAIDADMGIKLLQNEWTREKLKGRNEA